MLHDLAVLSLYVLSGFHFSTYDLIWVRYIQMTANTRVREAPADGVCSIQVFRFSRIRLETWLDANVAILTAAPSFFRRCFACGCNRLAV